MNRRGFLGAILATACAPAIVRADSLMRIVPRDALFVDVPLLLNHNKAACIGVLSNELLRDSLPDWFSLIRDDLLKAVAINVSGVRGIPDGEYRIVRGVT